MPSTKQLEGELCARAVATQHLSACMRQYGTITILRTIGRFPPGRSVLLQTTKFLPAGDALGEAESPTKAVAQSPDDKCQVHCSPGRVSLPSTVHLPAQGRPPSQDALIRQARVNFIEQPVAWICDSWAVFK